MKFASDRPYSDPEKAARKIVEIANSVEAGQDGRIYIELINGPFLFGRKARRRNIRQAWIWRLSAAGCCCTRAKFFVAPGLMCRELQLCCALFAFLFDEFALAFFERFQFLLCRLKKTVAWCYCQLRVSRHFMPTRRWPPPMYPSTGT